MTMTLVSTVTVGAGGAADFTFTSIPQTGTDLIIQFSGRSDTASVAFDYLVMFMNGNTSAVYTQRLLRGTGSATSSSAETSVTYTYGGLIAASTATSNTFGNSQIYIPNYTSNTNKSFSVDAVSETNATAAPQHILAGIWANTAAITSLKFQPSNGNFVQYTTASLYTITKGSGGATVS